MTVSVNQLLKLKKKTCWWVQPNQQLNLGQFGENRAAQFLQTKGFKVLAKNIRLAHDELDLVAWDPTEQEVVFVEVKTRHQQYSGHPSTSINQRKMRALLRAARVYMRKIWQVPTPFRIDLVTIVPGKIQHTPNITWEMLK